MQGGLSALMMCCEEGKSEMAKLLLDSQANPDLQQSVSITPAYLCHHRQRKWHFRVAMGAQIVMQIT